MNRKTQAQRDAIDKRAKAYPRPISPWQAEALRQMAKGPLKRGRAGWTSESLINKYWQGQTILSLVQRRLCAIATASFESATVASITAAGRRELARHRGAP